MGVAVSETSFSISATSLPPRGKERHVVEYFLSLIHIYICIRDRSFTTMNMPRLAIESRIKAESLEESGNKEAIERKAKEIFMESVHALSELIAEQLRCV